MLTFPDSDERYATITSDFLLTGDLKLYRSQLASAYGTVLSKQMYAKIDSILGSDAYRLTWRTVAYTMRYGCKWKVSASRFGTDSSIVDNVVMFATDEAMSYVRAIADTNAVLDVYTPEEDAYFLKELTSFAIREVNTKLKFLVNYDQSMATEDYVQTLLMKGLVTIWRYSHFTKADGSRDLLKILNYAKASEHNAAMSVIRTQTGDSKSRLKNHMKACGTCPSCTRGEPMQCYTAPPMYEATLVPIDAPGRSFEADSVVERSDARMMLHNILRTRPEVSNVLTQVFNTSDIDVVLTQWEDKHDAKVREAMKELRIRS